MLSCVLLSGIVGAMLSFAVSWITIVTWLVLLVTVVVEVVVVLSCCALKTSSW